MAEKEIFSHKADVLRQRAEEKTIRITENLEAMSLEEIRRIVSELRVHKIELEMQSEEMINLWTRYHTLYDLAPIGYFTLSQQGLFLEANLAVSTMLGVDRGTLIKQRISRFILKEDQDIYYFHHKRLFETYSALGLDSVQANLGQTSVGRPSAHDPGNRQPDRQCHQVYGDGWHSALGQGSATDQN
jgi:PAS domain-containing protein